MREEKETGTKDCTADLTKDLNMKSSRLAQFTNASLNEQKNRQKYNYNIRPALFEKLPLRVTKLPPCTLALKASDLAEKQRKCPWVCAQVCEREHAATTPGWERSLNTMLPSRGKQIPPSLSLSLSF